MVYPIVFLLCAVYFPIDPLYATMNLSKYVNW